ncbi:predicted protein [Nematostella vectensis]|uniref:Uncharacterized protein n=1 Tax=Nematostella vectensis TaxID=45351 RepID=A7RS57_NEMVE|nr:uncharacterized protein LOC5517811 [Nematostella vectensis]XP_048584223.1 uncharacterized protein LOC5517811 [Nematostella vectensis]EDO45749.1 predicted protein [Nematostella vectensis]|eukprot:XP_001637812.1 predicted protein [Nematostella vectensis]
MTTSRYLTVLLCITAYHLSKAADPSNYVEITFGIPWREFCNLESYFKKGISNELLYEDGPEIGTEVKANKIVIFNFAESCIDKNKSSSDANVKFYISQASSNNSDDIDVKMTKKAYRVLNYYKENSLEQYLGTLFKNKIKTVGGKDVADPKAADKLTEVERLYIGLGVGLAILLVIVIISVIVAFCCNKNKKADAGNSYNAGNGRRDSARQNKAFSADNEPAVTVHGDSYRPAESTRF